MNTTFPSQKLTRMMDELRYLREHENVTVSDLSGSLAAQPEDIIQDLQELSDAGLPVVLSEAGCTLLPAFDKSTGLFELDETFRILQGLQIQFEQGSFSEQSFLVLQAKLFSALPESQSKQFKYFEQAAALNPPVSNPVNPECMTFIHHAVIHNVRIDMKYQSRKDAGSTWRELSPYSIVYRKNAWYVVGFCHRREEIRTFKLNRIHEYKPSQKPFITDPEFNLQDYLLYTWNIIGGEPQLVIIRFKGDAKQLILEKQISNGRVWKENGFVYLKVIVSSIDEIGWWVMQYGELAEVLQPDELRQTLAARAVKMANQYKQDLKSKHRGKKVIALFE